MRASVANPILFIIGPLSRTPDDVDQELENFQKSSLYKNILYQGAAVVSFLLRSSVQGGQM